MRKRNIDVEILRLLYAHSGNNCAFEGCHNPIFEDDGTLTGECCHIESLSPKGPRFNSHQSDEERNGYNNLILMCARHHKIVDRNPKRYTVEMLKEMKRTHEKQFCAKQLEATDMMLHQLQHDSERFWKEMKYKDKKDSTGFKIMVEEYDIPSLMKEVENVYKTLREFLGHIIDSYNGWPSDLKEMFWEDVKLGIPNNMTMLEMRYLQLCVMMLEKLMVYNNGYGNLLNKYKKELTMTHESAYYID